MGRRLGHVGVARAAAAPAMVRQGAAVPASLARLVVRREAAVAVAKLAAAVLAVASPVAKRAAAVLAVPSVVVGSTMHYASPQTKPSNQAFL